jgi:hypothetical protein
VCIALSCCEKPTQIGSKYWKKDSLEEFLGSKVKSASNTPDISSNNTVRKAKTWGLRGVYGTGERKGIYEDLQR